MPQGVDILRATAYWYPFLSRWYMSNPMDLTCPVYCKNVLESSHANPWDQDISSPWSVGIIEHIGLRGHWWPGLLVDETLPCNYGLQPGQVNSDICEGSLDSHQLEFITCENSGVSHRGLIGSDLELPEKNDIMTSGCSFILGLDWQLKDQRRF